MKKVLALLLAVCLVFSFAACGSKSSEGSDGPKILKLAESFAYASLDAHKDWNGWYTSIYGMTETLFKVGNDLSVQPLLATKAEASEDGLTWTISLDPKAAFSTGKALTADMAVRNLQRVAAENERFADMAEYVYAVVDDHTFTITTPSLYPTLVTDKLTNSALGIMDIDDSEDLDNAPICTGPFVIKSFEPEGTVEVEKNANYWNGDVKLDGVIFYYMNDDESKLLAMQNGEIDGYSSVTAAAKEIYQADSSKYVLTEIPGTRLQFYVLNKNTLSPNVRKAINLTVDNNDMADYLKGTVSPAVGPFGPNAPYGQATKPELDPEKAKELIEEDGYTLNAEGFYEKDGEVLTVKISYYFARSLDTIALLMSGQLEAIGIKCVMDGVEDADATYRATGDFDIALYCMIADQAGDPYFAINALFRKNSDWARGGFPTEESEALIDQLQVETDIAKRAELANTIVQMTIDDDAFGYVGLFNKTTVMKPGVVNIGENSPFDFYAVSADTDMQ